MKKLFIAIVTIITLITITSSNVLAQINELDSFKEKLASKVAELTKKNERVIAGTVTQVSKTGIKIKRDDDGDYDIKIDQDLTKFYVIAGTQKREEAISEIEKDMYVIVSGPVVDRVIEANFIYQDEPYLLDMGRVIEVDRTNGLLQVTTSAKERYTLDIEAATKQEILNIKTYEVEASGLSKIKEGDGIHFTVKKETNVKNRFSAIRAFIIPQEYFSK